jgi:NTP pyrophosphatase (non-canonical NTP hydrolase)
MKTPELNIGLGALTVNEAQRQVHEWITTVGVRYFNELTNTAVLMEEVGEVARIMARTYGEQSWKPNAQPPDLADEFADVLFVLICLANQTGVDLEAALERGFVKRNVRDANRHRNNPKLEN